MKEIKAYLPCFAPKFGWANRLLRIDLSTHRVSAEPMDAYIPDFIGGRGAAARLMWNEYPEPLDPFSPEAPLIVMAGALTGTRSPYSGRTAICGFAPQAYPYSWYTRANIGAHFGGELKRAGYDGLVITGASDAPTQILITDDHVCILGAEEWWGLDAYETLEAARAAYGEGARTLAIGPAGERLSRIATIQTATSSAAGQGGFGAVMGAKKLKAITVIGSGKVPVAEPEAFERLIRAIGEEVRAYRGPGDLKTLNEQLRCARGGRVRPYACTESCPTPCNRYFADMPGVAYPDRRWEGHWACVGTLLRGIGRGASFDTNGLFDWQLGLYGGLEVNVLSNRYGINQWELIISLVPWLETCQRAGLISEWNGVPMNWQSAQFWAKFLYDLAYREGMGDALAEGGLRAAAVLGLGEEFVGRYYTAWGYGGHWDGHASWSNYLVFPYWVVSALQWATDTRDPYSSSHCYVQNVMNWGPLSGRSERALTWDQMRAIAQKIYHSADAVDPYSGYKDKAFPAFYHDLRSVMKDSLPTDDQVFTLIYSVTSEDRFCRVLGIDGPDVDAHLFRLGTGTDWSPADFERAAERIYTLERAICVRHWGRDRMIDESALVAFEYEENWVNPLLGEKKALDRAAFRPVMDEYYGYLGWDPQTAWPTRQRLEVLGLGDGYEPMVAGAQRAFAARPPWPEPKPIRV